MGTPRSVELGILLFQMLTVVVGDTSTCVPGFEADLLVFKVDSVILHKDRALGNVGFDDCSGLEHFVLNCSNKHFQVDGDGTLKMNRSLTLREGYKNFFIHSWDSQGKNITVPACVVHEPAHHHHSHGHRDQLHSKKHGNHHGHSHNRHHRNHNHHNHDHHNHKDHHHQGDNQHHINKTDSANHHQHHITEMDSANHQKQHHIGARSVSQSIEAAAANPGVLVLHFPKSTRGLRRQKRAWVIPPINYPENDRGPFPRPMVQIRSDGGDEMPMLYSITGPGADLPPAGLFTIHRNTGWLYVTQPLDREKKPFYTLQAHAVYEQSGKLGEEPMDINVVVIDQNDNKPLFTLDTYLGQVPEASPLGTVVCRVNATDADAPGNDNSDVRYVILNQEPKTPADNLFAINPVSGEIRVNAGGLDREQFPKYTLDVQAADLRGDGLSGKTQVILTVTDSNDNAPAFQKPTYVATVKENQAGAMVVKMTVTDGDEPHSLAWNAKFTIVDGDPTGLFTVETNSVNKQEGIIKTAKALDFEKNSKYTLMVAVENEAPFALRLPTATATVTVNVEDVNEAPIFSPGEKLVVKQEDLPLGSDVVAYIATDPDTARKQKVSYKILRDQGGWLNINKQSGLITVKSNMDRESPFVIGDKYTALIGAVDDDEIPATGTGTLIIQLEDVNDNYPSITKREFRVCNKESAPQELPVMDLDSAGHAAPFSVTLQGPSKQNWTARMNDTKTGIILTLAQELPSGEYTVVLSVADTEGKKQDSTVQAIVCDCKGDNVVCSPLTRVAGMGLPVILGILGAIFMMLLLVLLLLLFLRRRGREVKEPLLPEEDVRDNIYYYDEEGGGEDDQDFDLSELHLGLDNRPGLCRTEVMPDRSGTAYGTRPQYRPRPANPQDIGDIGNFIDDNLKAADNDPTAPPYDSLLVFDYEGGGSDAGSLSSLNSSSSGDQDYDCLAEWGPRFKKLADMYGGGDDDDML